MSWGAFKEKDVFVEEYKNYEEIVGKELARELKKNKIILAQITTKMRMAGFGGYHSTTPPTKKDNRKSIIFINWRMSPKNRRETAWHEFGHFLVKKGKLKVPKRINTNSHFYKDFRNFGYPKSVMNEEHIVEEYAKSKTRQIPKKNIAHKKIVSKKITRKKNLNLWELP